MSGDGRRSSQLVLWPHPGRHPGCYPDVFVLVPLLVPLPSALPPSLFSLVKYFQQTIKY